VEPVEWFNTVLFQRLPKTTLHWPEHEKILHKKYTIPVVDDEYARAFPSDTEGARIVHVGTHCLQNLINDKIKDLLSENLSNMSLLRQRWLEFSPALFSFLQSSPKSGDVFRDRTFHPYTDNLSCWTKLSKYSEYSSSRIKERKLDL
jgi:hypothetical protein